MTAKKQITVEVSDTVYSLLEVLGEPQAVVAQLIDHAQQGVYRPGAWERAWICQAFGYDFHDRLEPGDPYDRKDPRGALMFERPKRA